MFKFSTYTNKVTEVTGKHVIKGKNSFIRVFGQGDIKNDGKTQIWKCFKILNGLEKKIVLNETEKIR